MDFPRNVKPSVESTDDFRKYGKQMIDWIADYHDNIRNVQVIPDVKPGYMRHLLPKEAPQLPENFENVINDINKVIVPGLTHFHSPQFHAYYPTGNTYPSLIGDMLSDAIGCVGLTWMANPACTELEMITVDWVAKMLDLPECFLNSNEGKGGGVIQGSASESVLVALLAARARKLKQMDSLESDHKLVAYASKQAHSSVERAALLANTKMRLIETDDKFGMRGDSLLKAVKEDKGKGFIPFFVCATLGTTSVCSFDVIKELGEVAESEEMWMHIDAAYAGNAFICPEYRYLLDGVDKTDSFTFNANKGLLVHFDCTVMFVKDATDFVETFNVNPLYLQDEYQNKIPDYRHWQIPLGRRFRSLKLWLVLKTYGVQGLQQHIRKQIHLADQFKKLVESDKRFEIFADVIMGLVSFRYKGDNEFNRGLNRRINKASQIHITPSCVNEIFVLRFVVGSRLTESQDIEFAWKEISKHVSEMEAEQELANDKN